jgi:hypothetical protein
MNICCPDMSFSALKAFTLALALILVFLTLGAEQVSARSKKHRHVKPSSMPSIMVDESGTPIIMQGLERPKRALRGRRYTNTEGGRRVYIPRGSATFIPPVSSIGGLPRTPPLMVQPPAVAPYSPPPINNPSERVMQYNQSFPLNRGLGLNPTDRDSYVRYHLNN